MAKIKERIRNLPIMPTFVLLTVIFILVAMLIIECEKTALINAQHNIVFQYADIVEGFNAEKVWGDDTVIWFSSNDSYWLQFYELLLGILPAFTYIFCSFFAGLIFYRSKIKQPLFLLSESTKRIAENDLNFSLQYNRSDEMGKLCFAFEKMRSALEKNNREMWRQMDERKRLNASFSHDLRTPLTVLEGHLNILQKYVPEGKIGLNEAIETYTVMSEQIDRLKNYVFSMNTLQRLEDIFIDVKAVGTNEFVQTLEDTATIICEGKKLIFKSELNKPIIYIDPEIVMQVFENLLSNAVRYAETSIFVVCVQQKDVFLLSVTDDGKGFERKALNSATDPFFSTEKKDKQHFGLGLNICKILCERHNGKLSLCNNDNGGATVTASFQMEYK